MTETLRLDLFLHYARFCKTRSLAAALAEKGLRVNGRKVSKPATPLRPGDQLAFGQGARLIELRILSLPERRGPAPEARACYELLSPLESPVSDD